MVTTDTRSITLKINRSAGTFSCSGGLTKAAVLGVAAFTGCIQTKADTGYRLTADDGAGGLPSVRGANFEVGSGTATKLQFCRGPTSPCVPAPPTDLSAAAAFSLQPSVRVVDAAGVTVTADSSTNVAIAILPGTPTSGCMISAQGLAYRLNAISAPALTPVSSNPFDVAIFGNPTKLAFITQPPASVVVGAPFGSTVQVAIENAQNVVISQGILASVALTIDKGPNGAVLTRTGGLTVATFTGCSVSKEGTGYTLKATALQTAPVTPLTAATSKAFDAVLAPTLVTLTTAPFSGVITWGGTVLLNVGVGPNGAAKAIQLQVSRDHVNWSAIEVLTTNAAGQASFAYRPSDNRNYRAVFAGVPGMTPGSSPTVRVVVRQVNLLRPTNLGATRTIVSGAAITFTSTVRPARPELPQAHVNFVVYRLVGSQWTLELSQMIGVDSLGRASLRVTFSTRGAYYVRSQAIPTPLNANSGWSPVERYAVI